MGVVNMLPAGSAAARTPAGRARKLMQMLYVLVLLVVAIVCLDLCVELVHAAGLLLADIAGVIGAISSRLH